MRNRNGIGQVVSVKTASLNGNAGMALGMVGCTAVMGVAKTLTFRGVTKRMNMLDEEQKVKELSQLVDWQINKYKQDNFRHPKQVYSLDEALARMFINWNKTSRPATIKWPEEIKECPHQSINPKQLCYRCIDANDMLEACKRAVNGGE